MKKIGLVFILIFLTVSTNMIAQDWPNLDRFKEDNKSLELIVNNGNRVVFMGNSITEGWTNIRPEFFKNKPYINRGISGQTTPQMLLRFRQDVVDLKPALVIILAGTNDIAENTGPSTLKMIADNIFSMAEIARENKIKIIISSVLPAYDYAWRPGLKPNEKIPALNIMLKKYATTKGIIYLDYFSAMATESMGLKEHYGSDGVHPNKAGYLVMENLVEAAIKQALNK